MDTKANEKSTLCCRVEAIEYSLRVRHSIELVAIPLIVQLLLSSVLSSLARSSEVPSVFFTFCLCNVAGQLLYQLALVHSTRLRNAPTNIALAVGIAAPWLLRVLLGAIGLDDFAQNAFVGGGWRVAWLSGLGLLGCSITIISAISVKELIPKVKVINKVQTTVHEIESQPALPTHTLEARPDDITDADE